MASPGNQNQSGPFDVQMLFKQSNPPIQSNPNTNPNNTSPFPPSPYPPPNGPFSYPPQTAPFHHHYLPYQQHHQLQQQHQQQQQHDPHFANMHHPRPISYPTPPNPNPGARLMAMLTNPPPSTPLQATVSSIPSTSDYPTPVNPRTLVEIPSSASTPNFAFTEPTPSRLPSSKLPRGRKLTGSHIVYDVDVRMQGEVQPQLEVTPITKYVSDPGLVVGRQIAVNRSYICYGLKLGAIRVLNINTALRALLKGHTQRVTDMAFFNEEVHLLTSASVDGRVFVWKINEGADAEDKPQITGHIIVAIQIVGEGESVHPRVCWHSHKQEFLVVGIGKRVLKIDTTKVGKNGVFSAEEPLLCSIDKLIDGVHYVGKHDGEVTDLSMCQWMTTRLASSSVDGTVKIWDDRKAVPLAVLRPHDGQPVYSATFLTAHQPQHINLITAGALNREVKIWASTSEEGWLLPSEAESWQCSQTLDLRSSAEPRVEDAFFNQVVTLPNAGLILLANAKKNAIYAVHVDYGLNPSATRMDYIAEFTVTMPILSLTGTSDCLPDGQHVVQVYCVQTQAIQQYALDLSQCLQPMLESIGSGKVDSNVFGDTAMPSLGACTSGEPNMSMSIEMSVGCDAPDPSMLISSSEAATGSRFTANLEGSEVSGVPGLAASLESKQSSTPATSEVNNVRAASPPGPFSPRISRQLSGFRNPSNSMELCLPVNDRGVNQLVLDYSVERRVDTVPSFDESSKEGREILQDDIPGIPNPTIKFKHPTHLITPSEILSMSVSSSENSQVSQGVKGGEAKVQEALVKSDAEGIEVEVKVVAENESVENTEVETQREAYILVADQKEKTFCSQASDLSFEMARECRVLSTETPEKRQIDDAGVTVALNQAPNASEEEMHDSRKDVDRLSESQIAAEAQQSSLPATKLKKQKGKSSQVSAPSSTSPSPFDSPDSSNETSSSPGVISSEAASSEILSLQETLNQLMAMQKEMQKQMTMMVAVPVTKEGRRLETALGRGMERIIKANSDALWARFQEENVKHEKLERERIQQITSLISNCMNKELPAMLEKSLKKELGGFGQAVARLVTPTVEKSISSCITESFQRGVGDKAVNQLEKSVNSKLEATIARHVQAQFQASGKQALQEALRSSFESSLIPAFEASCKTMFEQVDSVFQRGMVEHTTAAQQHFESTHSPLALALRDAVNSVSSFTQTLTGELADGQRKLLAIAAAGTNSKAVTSLATQSNGPLGGIHEIAMPIQKVEAPLDPMKELSRLISEGKYEEAFTGALQRSDVSIVSWLCTQVDLQRILSVSPVPLSQGVLLALLQQLACDISKETSQKLTWMRDVAVTINPADPMISVHVRPIFEQVYQILGHHRTLPSTTSAEISSVRLVMHVINSMLMSCK